MLDAGLGLQMGRWNAERSLLASIFFEVVIPINRRGGWAARVDPMGGGTYARNTAVWNVVETGAKHQTVVVLVVTPIVAFRSALAVEDGGGVPCLITHEAVGLVEQMATRAGSEPWLRR